MDREVSRTFKKTQGSKLTGEIPRKKPGGWLTGPPFSSLRARLLLLLFLALLPVYGFIYYSVFEARQQAAEHARENARWLTRFLAAEQKNLIEVIHQQLQALAQLPIVRRPDLAALCNRTFSDLRKQNALYTNMGVIDPDGTLRCNTIPHAGRINLSDRDYFREVLRTRAFAVGSYVVGRLTGKGIVNLGYPVLNAAGRPAAVVYISIDLAALTGRLLEAATLPEGSTLTVLNDQGTILVRHPDPEQWIGKSLPDAPLIRMILNHEKEGSAEETGVDGVERLYVFAPLSATPTSRVYVSVGLPAAVVFAGANKLLADALLLLALVTAVVIAATWVGSNALLLRPANALIGVTRRLGQGDLGARTDLPHTADEFGQMARSFDDMADALQTRQAETARAEARFTNIVDLAADAIISVDADQRILIFNQGAEKIFGYPAAEIVGQPLGRLLPAHLAEAHRAHVRRFAGEPDTARDMNRRAEIHGRRRDGTEFPAEASISKVKENGNFRFTVFLRDISARKQAEQALRQKDRLLTMVGAMAKVGGWEFDARTRKGTWTDEVAKIHDLDPEQETGVEMGLSFFQGESRMKIEAAVRDAIEHAQPYDLELEMITAKGNRKWVRTIGQPVQEDDTVVKVWGSFQDISEHKRAAQEIQRLNADLERKVVERTAELQAANQELEAFSYSVSHDLRAPLRSIDGFSQAVLEDYADRLDDQGREHLNRVRAATQHMGHLIDDLIKLARVARAEMKREVVDLSTLAGDVLAELQKREPDRRVECRIEPGLAAEGDARLLRVALDNLLGNAWKFTGRQPQPCIEFGAIRDSEVPSAFFVRDNGAGFDMTYADKLFGAFQRLHSLSEFPGTGVGLATVQRIIRRHGGRVWAEGAVGKGATFYFAL